MALGDSFRSLRAEAKSSQNCLKMFHLFQMFINENLHHLWWVCGGYGHTDGIYV
jgi:hypothetical protein